MRRVSLGVIALTIVGLLGLAGCGQDAPVGPGDVTAVSLQVVSGAGQVGNVGEELAEPLVVRVMDAAGRKPVRGIPVSFIATAGGGGFWAGGTVTDADGYASDYWRLGPAPGAQAAEARAVLGQSAVRRVFGAFSATAIGPAAKLAFTVQPSNVVAGAAIAPAVQVQVQDEVGQLVTSSTATITLATASGPGALGGTKSRAAVGGVATFDDLSLDVAGGYTLDATATNLAGATSAAFQTVAGPPVALAFDRQPASGTAGATLAPVVVSVRDAFGNQVTTATDLVTLSLTPGSGTAGALLGGTLAVSAQNGLADFQDLTVDRSGTGYTLTATSGLLTSAVSDPFTIRTAVAIGQVEAGEDFACGLTGTGVAYCWGENTNGQLGDGSTASTTRPVAVGGGLAFLQLAAGENHVCGVTTSWAVYCWGDNTSGQLGTGSLTPSSLPMRVPLPNAPASPPQLAAGAAHTCVLAGALYCWGLNTSGQLGIGTVGGVQTLPVPAIPTGTYAEVAAGARHTCARLSGGQTYCWGNNPYGQLGNGSVGGPVPVPQLVGGGRPFTSLAAGAEHSCGNFQGAPFCWGSNASGQVGTNAGTMTPSPVPVNVPTTSQLAAGAQHTCALTVAGPYCWGSNQYGQFGNGTTGAVVPNPVVAAGGLQLLRMSGGSGFTCAVQGLAPSTTGTALCWGLNAAGQVGDGTTTNRLQPVDVLF